MVQWLRIRLPMQGNMGLIPGQETKIPPEKVKEVVKVLNRVGLCNPMDSSPPDSSVHGDSPGKNTVLWCKLSLCPEVLSLCALEPMHPSMESLCSTAKTQCSQKKKKINFSTFTYSNALFLFFFFFHFHSCIPITPHVTAKTQISPSTYFKVVHKAGPCRS